MKRTRTTLMFLACLMATTATAWAQEEEAPFDYANEWIWGIGKNTNSRLLGSTFVRYSLRAKEGVYQTFALELANVKHPQEVKQGPLGSAGFIVGKSNYLFPIRLQYGRDWVLFNKAKEQGVQVNGGVSAGPTLGLVTPYYIIYQVSGEADVTQQYDPAVHTVIENILGSAGPLTGLAESRVVPGINLRASANFEFGVFKTRVSGFEAGVMLEAYTQSITLLPRARSIQFYPSAYIALYYGMRN